MLTAFGSDETRKRKREAAAEDLMISFDAFLQATAHLPPSEKVDWAAKIVIEPSYIIELENTLRASYPSNQYPSQDLEDAYCFNSPLKPGYSAARNKRYNPFNLQLPYTLEGYEHLYNHNLILRSSYYHDDLTKSNASRHYYNFLREYNVAYLTFLKAMNSNEQALTELKKLFNSNQMIENSKLKKDSLSEGAKRADFIPALLCYLMLDIVFAKNERINTAARVRALTIVEANFKVDELAKAFSEHTSGFVSDEKVYNLIPTKFMTKAAETGVVPHNTLFTENANIK